MMKKNAIYTIILLSVIALIPVSVCAHIIAGAEYYVDQDPGEGNGLSISAGDGNFNSDYEELDFELDLSGFTIGPHFLYVRMKNQSGIWGIPNKHLFMVTGSKQIVEAEYFIDQDPGEGRGIPLAGNGITFSGEVDTTDLSVGMHTLFIRMKNSEGKWGQMRKYMFETTQKSVIKGTECFIDTDPGVQQGSALSPTDGGFDESEENLEGEIDVSGLSNGTHKLYLRAKNSFGRWTQPPQAVSFTIPLESSPLLPPSNLKARAGVNSIRLTWQSSHSAYLAGYNVYRSTTMDDGYSRLNTNTIIGDSYTDNSGLIAGRFYYYYLTAENVSGHESDPSGIASAGIGQLKLFIPDSKGTQGKQVRLPINIANADALQVCDVDISLTYNPSILTAVKIEKTALSSDYGWISNLETPGVARAVIATTEGDILYGDGALFYILFNVKGNQGDISNFRFQVSETSLYKCRSGDDPLEVPLDLSDIGTFAVGQNYILGDLNGDGKINSADVVIGLLIAVGKTMPTEEQQHAGDVSGDGRLRANDVALILRLAADLALAPVSSNRAMLARSAGTVNVSIPDIIISAGATAEVAVEIDNAENLVGADIVLNYDPAIVFVSNVRLAPLTQNFNIEFNNSQPGQVRISLSSMNNTGLTSGTGPLVYIELIGQADATENAVSPLVLTSVHLNDTYGRDYKTSALQVDVKTDSGTLKIVAREYTLEDAIRILKILAGMELTVNSGLDVTNNDLVGNEDVIYILRIVSEKK